MLLSACAVMSVECTVNGRAVRVGQLPGSLLSCEVMVIVVCSMSGSIIGGQLLNSGFGQVVFNARPNALLVH